MIKEEHQLLRGTLDLLILQALSGDAKHGFAIAEWIEKATDSSLQIVEGTIYPALHRMENRGWIAAEWGVSQNNRRAKFYDLTDLGREQLGKQTSMWRRYVEAMTRALSPDSGRV